MAPRILVKARMDISASFATFSSSPITLQIMRKVSPLFLLAAPWNSSTTPWTISAIWLTKVITFAWSTSVAVLKSRMRVAPMMHSTRVPSTIASTQALSMPCMLCSMMFAPASPKPSARREPSLMIVFSKMTVSMISVLSFRDEHPNSSIATWKRVFSCFAAFARLISSTLNSSSATFMAASGFARIVSTFAIMFSTGYSTSRFASLAKPMDARSSITQTKRTVKRLNKDSCLTKGRRSK
mmetsp:Transcript_129083/g.306217  ORF Transcript_129083/g.306217 Transcript_129083/m.306217 type:complete len:240 (-) Transcript_129083:1476-2195(-)